MAVLEDDRHYFPPYEAVPLVRRATLDQHPEVGAALGELAGKISEEEMRRMNYAVDGEHRDPPTWRANSGSQNGSDGDHVLLYQPFFSHANLALRMSLAPFSQGRSSS